MILDAEGAPHVVGLVVIGEDGEVQAVLGKLEDLGDQLVGPGAGLLLGHAAEGEVAHLEEGGVAAVGSDDVDIVGAHALLHEQAPISFMVFLPWYLELVHSRVSEQQRGVIGHERGARIELVAALFEELEVGRADLGRRHGRVVRR